MFYFNHLVAGQDEAGYRDGAFTQAQFIQPTGLALDSTGEKLLVADGQNHRIRVVDLDRLDQVSTLAGTGVSGRSDGDLAAATFDRPERICAIGGDRFVVYDAGTQLFRLLDLLKGKVSTLGSAASLWNMAYCAQDHAVYFTQTDQKKVCRLDLEDKSISAVVDNDPRFSSPKAICEKDGVIYFSDGKTSLIGSFKAPGHAAKNPTSALVNVESAGNGQGVLELAWQGNRLYALQSGKDSLAVILPNYGVVKLANAWGFVTENDNPDAEPFIKFGPEDQVGFLPYGPSQKRFFLSRPNDDLNHILSIEDIDFASRSKGNVCGSEWAGDATEPTDYEYSTAKDPNVFRILIAGDSRVYYAPDYIPGETAENSTASDLAFKTLIGNDFSKQLELRLNTESVLKGSTTHFEVLSFCVSGGSVANYSYYTLTRLAEKYHVDLVLGLAGFFGYGDYYLRPLTELGIPGPRMDPEYSLKPIRERLHPGVAQQLFEYGVQKKIFAADGKNFTLFPDVIAGRDPEVTKDLEKMAGLPLKLTRDKLLSLKGPTHFAMFFLPFRDWREKNEVCRDFWRETCGQNQVDFFDLSDGFNALAPSYYPVNQSCCTLHYTIYGHRLVAQLLDDYLNRSGMVHFDMPKK